MKRLALMAFVAVSLAAAAEGMYKWVDEKGVTHYSESPPPDGKANKVEIKPTAPNGPASPTDWKQKELDSRQQHIQKEQAEKQQQKTEAERHNLCVEARRQLGVLQAGVPVFHVNERGERVFVEDDERQRKVEAAQERARKNCD